MSARKARSSENRRAHAGARGAAPLDPFDEPAPRPALAAIPWNKVALTDAQRLAVSAALLAHYPRSEIAAALGVSVRTLRRLLDDEPELADAAEAAREAEEAELRDRLMRNARNGSDVAALFLLKARHGYRDRDDAKAMRAVGDGKGGVLLLPADVPLDEWEAASAAQQAKYRERDHGRPEARDMRAPPTIIGEGLTMQRVLPGDLPG